jgi:hypothetical protein
MDLVKNTSDFRKESYRPVSYDTEIKILDHLDTKSNWLLRKEIVFKNKVHTDLTELISEAKDREIMTSLAVFKPTEIIDFTIEQVEREWDKNKLEKLKQDRSSNLFAQENEDLFEVVRKLPFKFSYVLKDCNGKQSKMMIYENSLKIYRDLKGIIDTAFDEGKLEGKLEIAKSAKQMGLRVDDIIKLTGLSKDVIVRL